MALIWRVDLNPESRNYVVDSAPYVTDLLIEFVKLEQSSDGRPISGFVDELEDGYFLWGILEHLVLFKRIESTRIIRILLIKPSS